MELIKVRNNKILNKIYINKLIPEIKDWLDEDHKNVDILRTDGSGIVVLAVVTDSLNGFAIDNISAIMDDLDKQTNCDHNIVINSHCVLITIRDESN